MGLQKVQGNYHSAIIVRRLDFPFAPFPCFCFPCLVLAPYVLGPRNLFLGVKILSLLLPGIVGGALFSCCIP
jgi:hypothetical protein